MLAIKYGNANEQQKIHNQWNSVRTLAQKDGKTREGLQTCL